MSEPKDDLIAWVYEGSPMPDCDNHAATVTAPLYVVHGQARYATEPVTMCVTCHAIVSDGLTLPEHFKTEEPARD